jgi:APA family basic amino acid/polyamine antiporter
MLLGLGSILGTGVFVSLSIAAGAGGPLVVVAIAVAAIVATCNGLSSAQLAANHAVSGGTYEYGYRWLHPALGFIAGWLFLCAKSASAATAALGFAGYAMNLLGLNAASWQVGPALGLVVFITLLVLGGVRRSNAVNAVLVSVTLLALLAFVVAGWAVAWREGPQNLWQLDSSGTSAWHGLLEASALMFVAYTGYGRIATMGEEIREPRRNIPRAMIGTLVVSMVVYIAVGVVAVAAVGAASFAEFGTSRAAPLEIVARQFQPPQLSALVAVGACTAMFGVLLNLSLGLSRVVLAMARRADLPTQLGALNTSGTTPYAAVLLVGAIIGGLVLIGNVKTTWSFSAFTVLLYYGLTNLAALRLTRDERLYPSWISWVGLLSCVFLAFWVQREVWLFGLAVIATGMLWFAVAYGLRNRSGGSPAA